MSEELRPRRDIRRFDVFAEYNKLKALSEGKPLDEAKGHGLWLAKVVASRRFAPLGAAKERDGRHAGSGAGEPERPDEQERFRLLGGELQTDELFDQEIVDRMGERFYHEVFAPTVEEHFRRGDRYKSIRDVLRKEWKPAA